MDLVRGISLKHLVLSDQTDGALGEKIGDDLGPLNERRSSPLLAVVPMSPYIAHRSPRLPSTRARRARRGMGTPQIADKCGDGDVRRRPCTRRRQVVGKHLGMFIDKKSIEISCIDDADAYLSRIMGLVDAKTVKHGPRRWRSTMTWWNPTAASIDAQVMSSIATGRDRTEPIEVSGSLGRCFRQLKLTM